MERVTLWRCPIHGFTDEQQRNHAADTSASPLACAVIETRDGDTCGEELVPEVRTFIDPSEEDRQLLLDCIDCMADRKTVHEKYLNRLRALLAADPEDRERCAAQSAGYNCDLPEGHWNWHKSRRGDGIYAWPSSEEGIDGCSCGDRLSLDLIDPDCPVHGEGREQTNG